MRLGTFGEKTQLSTIQTLSIGKISVVVGWRGHYRAPNRFETIDNLNASLNHFFLFNSSWDNLERKNLRSLDLRAIVFVDTCPQWLFSKTSRIVKPIVGQLFEGDGYGPFKFGPSIVRLRFLTLPPQSERHLIFPLAFSTAEEKSTTIGVIRTKWKGAPTAMRSAFSLFSRRQQKEGFEKKATDHAVEERKRRGKGEKHMRDISRNFGNKAKSKILNQVRSPVENSPTEPSWVLKMVPRPFSSKRGCRVVKWVVFTPGPRCSARCVLKNDAKLSRVLFSRVLQSWWGSEAKSWALNGLQQQQW